MEGIQARDNSQKESHKSHECKDYCQNNQQSKKCILYVGDKCREYIHFHLCSPLINN